MALDKLKQMRRLRVSAVALVDDPANKKPFYVLKSTTAAPASSRTVIMARAIFRGSPQDDERRLAYGLVYEPEVADAHNEWADEATIEEAAHAFMGEYQALNLMHQVPLEKRQLSIVESYVAPHDLQIGGQKVKRGSWIMVGKIHDEELWTAVKGGALTGWSLEGFAEFENPDKPAPAAAQRSAPTQKESPTARTARIQLLRRKSSPAAPAGKADTMKLLRVVKTEGGHIILDPKQAESLEASFEELMAAAEVAAKFLAGVKPDATTGLVIIPADQAEAFNALKALGEKIGAALSGPAAAPEAPAADPAAASAAPAALSADPNAAPVAPPVTKVATAAPAAVISNEQMGTIAEAAAIAVVSMLPKGLLKQAALEQDEEEDRPTHRAARKSSGQVTYLDGTTGDSDDEDDDEDDEDEAPTRLSKRAKGGDIAPIELDDDEDEDDDQD